MVALLPSFERRADRIRNAWLPMLIAVGLAFMEIWLSGLLRLWLESVATRFA